MIENKLGLTDSVKLAHEEEKISKKRSAELLKNALTDRINDREIYMKGIDHSYY